MLWEPDFVGTPRVVFGDGLTFVRVCPKCGRFVKADDKVYTNETAGVKREPNATCNIHGRVEMPCEGWVP